MRRRLTAQKANAHECGVWKRVRSRQVGSWQSYEDCEPRTASCELAAALARPVARRHQGGVPDAGVFLAQAPDPEPEAAVLGHLHARRKRGAVLEPHLVSYS